MRKITLIVILLTLLSACGGSPSAEGAAEVYYAVVMTDHAQPPKQTVRAVRLAIPDGADPLTFAAGRMVQKPDDDDLRSPFPDNLRVLGAHLDGDCAVFTLSGRWLDAAGLDKTLAEYCMLKTALQFEGVTSARWEAQDPEVDRAVAGPVLREELYIDAPLVLVPSWQDIKLYFADTDGNLQGEIRPVVLRESESDEWYRQVVDGLIAGPLTPGLAPVMPGRARLLGVWVENRICYVNFSREFITNAAGDADSARLTLRALVQSLTELQGVSFVKIRVDGEDLTDYFGLDVSMPLEREEESH